MKRLQQYLKNNSGDGYIVFLILFVALVLIFSAIFATLRTTIEVKSVYNEVEDASNVVMAQLKVESYDSLIDGTTENSYVTLTNQHMLIKMNDILKATLQDGRIIKRQEETQNITYEIYDFHVTHDNAGKVTITFSIDIPVYLNGELLFIETEKYQKSTIISFKES